MHALLLSLAFASIEPIDASPDLLQGIWHGDNDATVVIIGDSYMLRSDDGYTEFTAKVICRAERLRIVDNVSVLELPYRVDGSKLWIGNVEYRRRWGS